MHFIEFSRALLHPVFERLIGSLGSFEEARIVHRHRCLASQADDKSFRSIREDARIRMAEKQPADDFASAR